MKLNEQQLFDYIYCPTRYDIKHEKRIDIQEPISMARLLGKVGKYFYVNLFNQKVCSTSELKNKWDSICKQYPDFIDQKEAIAGWGAIVNMYNWAAKEQLVIADIDTKYTIVIDHIELEGNMDPIIRNKKNKFELLSTNFSTKIPDPIEIDMKLKHTLDSYAFRALTQHDIDAIKVHHVRTDKDILSYRTEPDYRRLLSTIKSVEKGIEQKIFFPRETALCNTCTAKQYCRFWYQ